MTGLALGMALGAPAGSRAIRRGTAVFSEDLQCSVAAL